MLGISASALFGLGWLFVCLTSRIERQIARRRDGPGRATVRMLPGPGRAGDGLLHARDRGRVLEPPFIVLIVWVWAIARGSAAVAGEIERGTLDLVLSRPVSRAAYLASHVAVALVGPGRLAAALVAGNLVGAATTRSRRRRGRSSWSGRP